MFGHNSDTARINELQDALEGANLIVAMLVKQAGGKVVIPFSNIEALSDDNKRLTKEFQPDDTVVLELVDDVKLDTINA